LYMSLAFFEVCHFTVFNSEILFLDNGICHSFNRFGTTVIVCSGPCLCILMV
jgi:hypothetical protein